MNALQISEQELARILQAYYRRFVTGVSLGTDTEGRPALVVHFAQGSENAPTIRVANQHR